MQQVHKGMTAYERMLLALAKLVGAAFVIGGTVCGLWAAFALIQDARTEGGKDELWIMLAMSIIVEGLGVLLWRVKKLRRE